MRVSQQVSDQMEITLAYFLLVQHILLPQLKAGLVVTQSSERMWLISNRWWFIENVKCGFFNQRFLNHFGNPKALSELNKYKAFRLGKTDLVINCYHRKVRLSQGQHEDQLPFNISVSENAENVLGKCEVNVERNLAWFYPETE